MFISIHSTSQDRSLFVYIHLDTITSATLRDLGNPFPANIAVLFNIVQKAFDPAPLSFEHDVVNFSEGI